MITRIDEASFQVFAPNADAMAEAKEMMEDMMEDQVCFMSRSIRKRTVSILFTN